MESSNWRQKIDEIKSGFDFDKIKYQMDIETNFGKLTLNFYPDRAPNHCINILGLAKVGYYTGLSFHRIIKGFVIQGGCPVGNGTGGPGYRVNAEFNDTPHKFGTLSMARTMDPNSAGSQFFICLGDVPDLDNQYTVFGQLADDKESTETLKTIGNLETGRGDIPVERVSMTKVVVRETPL